MLTMVSDQECAYWVKTKHTVFSIFSYYFSEGSASCQHRLMFACFNVNSLALEAVFMVVKTLEPNCLSLYPNPATVVAV